MQQKPKKTIECRSTSDKLKGKKDNVDNNAKIPLSTCTEKREKPLNGNSVSSTTVKNEQEATETTPSIGSAHSKSSTRSKKSTHSKSSAHSTSSWIKEMKEKEETDKKRRDTHK